MPKGLSSKGFIGSKPHMSFSLGEVLKFGKINFNYFDPADLLIFDSFWSVDSIKFFCSLLLYDLLSHSMQNLDSFITKGLIL